MRVVFLEDYDEAGKDYLQNIKKSYSDVVGIVVKDTPFLPEGVLSIYDYFLFDEGGMMVEWPVSYAMIQSPDCSIVQKFTNSAYIYSYGKHIGVEYYRETEGPRTAKQVVWYDDQKQNVVTDYYGKFGFVYKKEFNTPHGVLRSYYTPKSEERIMINASNGTATLYKQGEIFSIFDDENSLIDWIKKECKDDVITQGAFESKRR